MRFYLRALRYFSADWPLIVLLLILIGLSTGAGLLMAWPMAILVDSVLSESARNDWFHQFVLSWLPEHQLGQIVALAAASLGLKFGQDVLSMLQTIVTNHLNYNGLMRVRCELYRKLQALNLGYHRSQPQGDAIYRLSSDTFGCQAILSVFVSTGVAVVTLAVMLALLLSRSVNLTLLAFSIAPALAAVNIIYGRRLHKRTMECKQQDMHFMTVVQRSMSCIGLIQAFAREADEFGQFQTTVRNTIAAWWRLNWQQMAYNLIVGTLFGIGGAAIFGYGGYLVYRDQFLSRGNGGLSVGDLMIFTSYLSMLWGPLCTLTGFGASIQNGAAGAQRVFEVLDRDPVIRDAPDAVHLPRRPRTLELSDVSFGYDPARPVVRDLSLKITPGQMVAFVGPSGVGKSTILTLLPRFYDPNEGAVRFDGIDARQVRVQDLRRHVALVLQDSVILPTTVAENISYGRPHATREQVRRAAELAGAAQFIEELADGYDTQIAEGGQNLSGGQRQRIAIARALLTESPFILMDEPTSALDPRNEQHITQTLRRLKGLRTIVLVSHRLSTVVDCDQIFVMDCGRIVERGTHEELMDREGVYFEMARQQQMQSPDELTEAASAA